MHADQGCSLYRHFAVDGTLLYVGISLSALNRLGQHKQNSEWFDNISRVEIEQFPSRDAALEAEREAIQEEKPVYNVRQGSRPAKSYAIWSRPAQPTSSPRADDAIASVIPRRFRNMGCLELSRLSVSARRRLRAAKRKQAKLVAQIIENGSHDEIQPRIADSKGVAQLERGGL